MSDLKSCQSGNFLWLAEVVGPTMSAGPSYKPVSGVHRREARLIMISIGYSDPHHLSLSANDDEGILWCNLGQ